MVNINYIKYDESDESVTNHISLAYQFTDYRID